MRTIKKNVYYCEFCSKHGLSSPAMSKHEQHCTLNPDRTCRWRIEGNPRAYDFRSLVANLLERLPLSTDVINWLHDEVEGCPACMLAVLRQANEYPPYAPNGYQQLWVYDEEVERFRAAEREHAYEQERREIEATFL